MAIKVVQFKNIGIVTFSQNRRSKNIKISVKPDKSVLVSFPFYVSLKKVAKFVDKNEQWIRSQQEKYNEQKFMFEDGFVLKTKLYSITFIAGEKNKAEIKDSLIEITIDDFNKENSRLFIEKIITDVYRFEAKKILPAKLNELANLNGFSFSRITIRNNKRNWGSCSSKNNISLNLQMMKLPDELIDYILLHELVHTEVKNHGPQFWERLNQVSDNRARELSKQVKQFSTYNL
ncbi:MAG: M48 family metallopeptidase [Prolixibacteraceae bacterium]|jgi:predicted metal-dependent hydrolase|nr:M48 family metallopeptidase [Prolixibacteraceae bacterium]MBT6006444.1 M48 family metallopeptidase [Prolixibacteraceae bacterium]MBT6763194.1 M48 family metallopeptidase [Prolixibacteraceae bacterium]MBT7000810.1 M48 family metallopeptidase [Prolixibacteraceae bacterium]MBT7397013.1 M48 family metallopeptidase [Prolixibacteraceae bacterium]